MKKIVALPKYEKQAKRLLSAEEREAMEATISAEPLAHPVIRGTGGFRKARWGRGSSGKSGGVRTIFYYYVAGETVFFTLLYAKNEMETLSHAEQNELKRLAQTIEQAAVKGTAFGRDLISAAKQIRDHVQGRKVLKEYTLPMPVDVKGIRTKAGMSQSEFASTLRLNYRTLQQWEQGKAAPDLAVCAYLTVIARNPKAVRIALGSDPA